jgi:uncharacterized protein (TIGR03083 family)
LFVLDPNPDHKSVLGAPHRTQSRTAPARPDTRGDRNERTGVVRIRPVDASILDRMTQGDEVRTNEVWADDVVDEVGELFTTLLLTPPHRLTNCRGWTAHDLVAHLAAGAAEEADLIEAHLTRSPGRATRGHAEREAPYRSLADTELRDQLLANGARLTEALAALPRDESGEVLFTGRRMTAADFAMHSRSECAIHRWDLVGRDDVGWRLLAQPELTTHALTVLTQMSTLPESPGNRIAATNRELPATTLVLRSEPHDDVVVTVAGGTVGMTLEPITGTTPAVELDPAARLLLLWGRREPSAAIDVHVTGPDRELANSLFPW